MKYPIIFKAIVGSQSYGTATPESDVDYKGVYMQPVADLIGFDYKEQFEVGKDEVYYELRRFIQLLQSANPTMLELLYCPVDCVMVTTPQFEALIANRANFLTKQCLKSFGGYAVAQIQKAKGLDKKMNWENSKITRKSPIDFIYCYKDGRTFPITKWLKDENLKQEFCGLVALDHFKDCYALYYDYNAHFGQDANRTYEPLGFKGIVVEDSNDLRLSSVIKGLLAETIICYNKDGYSLHCKQFKEYTTWLANRNTQRYVDISNHNQKIDGKNLLHCRRLLDMAKEIATEGTLTVRRPNASYLLDIRKGKVPLEKIIKDAEQDIIELDELFNKCSLPESVDKEFANSLLLKIRNL